MTPHRLRWPSTTHVFERDGVCAVMNSLSLRPVFLNPSVLPTLREFAPGAQIEDILTRVPETDRESMRELIGVLADAKALVNANASDADILRYFQEEQTGHPYVSIAYFILTDACNFGCRYCFVENRMQAKMARTRMTSETIRRGLDFFQRLIRLKPHFFEEEKTIVIYGGEPMLNVPGLTVLLEEIRRRKTEGGLPAKTEISMITNAAMADARIARLLAAHHVNVAVSIDGDADATNSARQYKDGSPVWSDVLQGFRALKDAGVNVGISCTLNAQSLVDFDLTLAAIEELGAQSLGFNIVLSSRDYPLLEGYDEAASRAILRAFEIFRRKNVFEDRVMRKVDAFVDGKLYPFDCGASGGGQIVIAPDGAVGICHGYLGDRRYFPTTVHEDGYDPSVDPVFLEWSRRSPLNMDACADCPALGICGGGCPLNADTEAGSIWALDRRFCTHAKMTLEWLIWDLWGQMRTDGKRTEATAGS